MPYVPSEKTIPPAEDRKILDPFIEEAAKDSAQKITKNFSLITEYKKVFMGIVAALRELQEGTDIVGGTFPQLLAQAIFDVGKKYNYEGAFLGELNYAITRFIQRVPGIKVQNGEWLEKDELRYWLYAATVQALVYTSIHSLEKDDGIGGVFEDIKDEYKWKVNRSYEAAQIVKSGDCYDTPYYTRLLEVVDNAGRHVGYIDILLKRNNDTLHKDLLDGKLVLGS